MHLLIGAFIIFLLWSHPITRAMIVIGLVALICFPTLPPVIAWVIVAVVTVGLWAGAAEEMRARRQWREDDEMIRRAQVRRARRYLDP
jgi:Mg2+/citrate symporter